MIYDEEYNNDICMSNMLNIIFDFDLNNSKIPLEYYCHKTGNVFTFSNHTIDVFGNVTNKKNQPVSMIGKKYFMLSITDDSGQRHGIQLHRAICSSFLGEPPRKYTADHIDINPLNNFLWNLRWSSIADQNRNKNKRKLQVDTCPVIGNHIETGENIYFDSFLDARRSGYFHIRDCLYGKRNHCGGYTWKCPQELPDLDGEDWRLWRTGKYYNVWISNMNRIMYEFGHGYKKKMFSDELFLRGEYHTISDINKGCEGIHRVIWAVFNGPIPDGMIIHHIDHDKTNNSLNNLELADQSINGFAAHNVGRFDGTMYQRQPLKIDGIDYVSSSDAARKLNPSVTDKKEIKRIRSLIRNRCISPNYPAYVFV